MRSLLFLILTFILITATLLIDMLARHFYLYWTTGGVDLFVHFIGGLSAAFLFSWFYLFSGLFQYSDVRNKKISVWVFVYLLAVGILWEIYEYKSGLTSYSTAFIFDTISDLSMDLSGGLLAFVMISHFIHPEVKKNN